MLNAIRKIVGTVFIFTPFVALCYTIDGWISVIFGAIILLYVCIIITLMAIGNALFTWKKSNTKRRGR